jgi:hypothetical protein
LFVFSKSSNKKYLVKKYTVNVHEKVLYEYIFVNDILKFTGTGTGIQNFKSPVFRKIECSVTFCMILPTGPIAGTWSDLP